MSTNNIPYIRWGGYKSTDEKNPDVLKLRVIETSTFTTKYSDNARVQLFDGSKFNDAILVLKSHESQNVSLFKQWSEAVKDGKLKENSQCAVATWLGLSRLGRKIRRWKLST